MAPGAPWCGRSPAAGPSLCKVFSMAAVENWFEEKQSAWLYRQLAAQEPDPHKQKLFTDLAAAAERQALDWERTVGDARQALPEFRPTLRARVSAWLLRRLGVRVMRPVLAAMKIRGLSVYRGRVSGRRHPMPTSVEEVGGRHRGAGSGGNLRAAVFGINDGLVSNTSLIMGVAGASVDVKVILTTGVAGLLAGALSMAAGEYVSMRSQREMYEYQIGLERDELDQYPEEEAEELALIYNARGMEMDYAREVAGELLRDPEHALDTLAREELGLNPDDLGSPWGAALFSFLAFSAGALVPLLPFLLESGAAPLPIAAGLAAVCLCAVGAALSLFTGRQAWWGGLRMVLIGGGAGVVTYVIGHWLGVSLG
jgi:VIT1/CCC1 family predicted Fe2+/Mn2+ transporter